MFDFSLNIGGSGRESTAKYFSDLLVGGGGGLVKSYFGTLSIHTFTENRGSAPLVRYRGIPIYTINLI